MSQSVKLIPMYCIKCQTPITAKPDEVAWVCTQCGQGMLLGEEKGLTALEFHYAKGIPAGAQGKPIWRASGQPALQRSTYSGDQSREMHTFWQTARQFYVPAYTLPLESIIQVGMQWLKTAPVLQPGAAVPFLPITVPPGDVRPMAEFITLGMEAERNDKLKELRFELQLSEPELWIVP